MTPTRIHRRTRVPLALACLAVAVSAPLEAQTVSRRDSAAVEAALPDLHRWREAGLSAIGGSLLLLSHFADVRYRDVPAEGFNRLDIDLSLDRAVIEAPSLRASDVSDWTRNVAIAFPFAISLTTSPRGARLGGLGRTALVHAETMLISQGLTLLGKKLLGRARPYAYLPAMARPHDASYDVTRDRTFVSMPSGHSSSAWTGVALGLTEYLLNRQEAGWWERAGVGFVGGALAGATSALRVAAGQHFPSDVFAGAGIGIAVGVTMPLLHRGTRSMPSAKSWLQVAGGVLVGSLVGTAAAQGF